MFPWLGCFGFISGRGAWEAVTVRRSEAPSALSEVDRGVLPREEPGTAAAVQLPSGVLLRMLRGISGPICRFGSASAPGVARGSLMTCGAAFSLVVRPLVVAKADDRLW